MSLEMQPETAPPAYSLGDRKSVTFAQVATKIGNYPTLREVLLAFGAFLSSQENVRLSRNQLEVLKSQSVLVIEESASYVEAGGDVSQIAPSVAEVFQKVSSNLKSKTKWENAIADPNTSKDMESQIDEAFEELEMLRKRIKGNEMESTIYRDDLKKAQQQDHKKLEELEAIVKQMPQSSGSLDKRLQISMEESLKIIGDPTVQQQQIDAKRSLRIVAELTGKSLPPSTLLGKEFVTIGSYAIHQGSSYDVFLGEYFTGEKIAIKVLRHRVDELTAQKTLERFARQTLIWSSLRHSSILPFYGIGVAPSSVVEGEFQLYMVSPYLQNQDVRRYLKKYSDAPPGSRLRMISDVARGLAHMHEGAELPEPGHGIVHSALNIFNVLIKDSGRAVISGFGHSKVIKDFQESFTGDNSEYRYMGPEMMQDEAPLTYGTDLWSWAMTSLEILTDVPPFGEKTKGPMIIQRIAMGKKPSRADHPKLEEYDSSDQIWNLFEECWDTDPAGRPPADEVVRRLRPMLNELGRKSQGADQKTDTQPGKGPVWSDYGKRDPAVQPGRPPLPVQNELGNRSDSAVQANPPLPKS